MMGTHCAADLSHNAGHVTRPKRRSVLLDAD
jgi:hypothetical protein